MLNRGGDSSVRHTGHFVKDFTKNAYFPSYSPTSESRPVPGNWTWSTSPPPVADFRLLNLTISD